MLERGHRLEELSIFLTARRYDPRTPLSDEQVSAIDVLSMMEVCGTLQVRVRRDLMEVRATVKRLGLEERMRESG